MSTIYHMVHYRRFDGDAGLLGGKTLEVLCREALSTEINGVKLWSRPADRVFDVGGGDGRKIYLNKTADLSQAVFGEMCLAQEKDLQTILKMEPAEVALSDLTTAKFYDLEEREAPEGSQFIRGLAYWLSIGNHLFFVKTHSMTPDLIRSYFDWLIKIRAAVIPPQFTFELNAELDNTAAAGDIGEIRSLRVSGKSAPQAVMVADQSEKREVTTSRRVADKSAQMQQAIPIVEAIFGKKEAASLVESLGPQEYLSVDASVKVRGRRTEESRKKFQAIANDLADASDAKVQIEGKDGRILDGDAILRTRMPFKVPFQGSNLLDFANVAAQLQEVYVRYVNDGKIEAT